MKLSKKPNKFLSKKILAVYKALENTHKDATIELNFKNPCELLVATILSAQCTDVRVNAVTKELFKKFKKPEDYLTHPLSQLESLIRPTGFFRQKAKSIRGAMKIIVEQHDSKVPMTMEELVKLPGVGRKTANVILGNVFNTPGFPVDTHVKRLTKRIGLTKLQDPVKIEREITVLIPKTKWTQFSHLLIFHGRRVCKARKPLCEQCSISHLCLHFTNNRMANK